MDYFLQSATVGLKQYTVLYWRLKQQSGGTVQCSTDTVASTAVVNRARKARNHVMLPNQKKAPRSGYFVCVGTIQCDVKLKDLSCNKLCSNCIRLLAVFCTESIITTFKAK